MNGKRRVVVTGLGPISPVGVGAREFAAGGEAGRRDLSERDLPSLLRSPKAYLDPASLLTLASCALALDDARVKEIDQPRSGIFLGTSSGCSITASSFLEGLETRGVRLANSILFSHAYMNTPTSLAAMEYGFQGAHATFCHGPGAGTAAICRACAAISRGSADLMTAGGVDAGQGAGMVVLEEAEHAAARGARIYAEVTGWEVVGADEEFSPIGPADILFINADPDGSRIGAVDFRDRFAATGAPAGPLGFIEAALLAAARGLEGHSCRIMLVDGEPPAPAALVLEALP